MKIIVGKKPEFVKRRVEYILPPLMRMGSAEESLLREKALLEFIEANQIPEKEATGHYEFQGDVTRYVWVWYEADIS